jgi:uncharacterized protein
LSETGFKEDLDKVNFWGHRNISGMHRNSIEITKDREISKKADCIIGVRASKACADLEPRLKDWVRSGRWIEFEIRTGIYSFTFKGRGSPRLDLTDGKEIVLRRSDYTSSRTAALNCSYTAIDIPRDMIRALQNPNATGTLTMRSLPQMKDLQFQ